MGIEIGTALAEKSKGLFSAEDWQCAKVGYRVVPVLYPAVPYNFAL